MNTTGITFYNCEKDHSIYKSSDYPVCPACESKHQPGNGFFSGLGAPAKRALEAKGITTLPELSKYSEKEILSLHGMGPGSIPLLKKALNETGLQFREK